MLSTPCARELADSQLSDRKSSISSHKNTRTVQMIALTALRVYECMFSQCFYYRFRRLIFFRLLRAVSNQPNTRSPTDFRAWMCHIRTHIYYTHGKLFIKNRIQFSCVVCWLNIYISLIDSCARRRFGGVFGDFENSLAKQPMENKH